MTLREMSRQIAGDSTLFAARMLKPVTGARESFSDLFAEACAGEPASDHYRFAIEFIFEGYLLHYRGHGRLLEPEDSDFNLLAGDYMYAQGLTHVAALQDPEPVRLLAELVSLCAHMNSGAAGGKGADDAGADCVSLTAWLVTTLCLAGRALSLNVAAECTGELDRFRDAVFAGDLHEADLLAVSMLERLAAGFSYLDITGWLSRLNLAYWRTPAEAGPARGSD